MGACKTLRHILIDKNKTITSLADDMGKPRRTVINTFVKDSLSTRMAVEYAKALGCGLYFIDEETGKQYKIETETK